MVAQPGTYQASFNGGELSEELHGRTDIKQFYSGAKLMLNAEPVPQGGFRLLPRSRFLGRLRKATAAIAGSSATSLGPHSAAAIIASVTFSAEQPVAIVRLDNFFADVALGQLIRIEAKVGANWIALGPAFKCGTTATTRAAARAPGEPLNASAVRVRLIGAPPADVTFSIGAITVLKETAAVPNFRIRPFTFARDQNYIVVLIDNYADIYRDGVWVATAVTGMGGFNDTLDYQQRFDTALLFHDHVVPVRIVRDGADHEWPLTSTPFTGVPQVDLGSEYFNAIADVWQMFLRFPFSGTGPHLGGVGLLVAVTVNGEQTTPVATGDPADFAGFTAALQAAIIDLPSIGAGVTVTQIPESSGLGIGVLIGTAAFEITFAGADNQGQAFAVSAEVLNTADAAATTAHKVTGKPGGEPIMSVSAGYPACGVFWQDSLLIAGFKSKKGALLKSQTGEYYTIDTAIAAANGPVLINLDTDGAEQIRKLVRATHLLIFTSDAEYFVSDRAINRTTTPNIVQSSRNGAVPGVPIVESEGFTYYMGGDREDAVIKGVLLYAAAYDDVAQKYISTPQSLLASHIVTDVTDMALQRFGKPSVADRLWMVRADGTMAVGVLIRNQDVSAFVRWQTPGLVLAAAVDGRNRPHIGVARIVDGADDLFLERLELGLIFDATVSQSFDPPASHIDGLWMHEGAQVWANADGYVVGPFTVTGAAIDLPFAAASVDVGRWTPPRVVTLPLPDEVAERVVVRRPKRVHTVRADLIATTSLAVGANGLPVKNQPLARAGDPTDQPVPPATRRLPVEGLTSNYDGDDTVEISQTKPGWLQVRGLTVEAK